MRYPSLYKKCTLAYKGCTLACVHLELKIYRGYYDMAMDEVVGNKDRKGMYGKFTRLQNLLCRNLRIFK
jgi:hypothetical protein